MPGSETQTDQREGIQPAGGRQPLLFLVLFESRFAEVAPNAVNGVRIETGVGQRLLNLTVPSSRGACLPNGNASGPAGCAAGALAAGLGVAVDFLVVEEAAWDSLCFAPEEPWEEDACVPCNRKGSSAVTKRKWRIRTIILVCIAYPPPR